MLLAVAGLAALVVGLRDLVLRPVLTADVEGITVVDGWTRRTASWEAVHGLRVVTDRRTPLLELDLDGALVVLSRRRLGSTPHQVLEQLDVLRSR